MTAEEFITTLIDSREGIEFTDDPNDAGGPTKYGITQETLSRWRGYKVSRKEVEMLPRPEAEAIYRFMFLERFKLVTDDSIRVQLADWHIHGGAPIRTLQRLLGVDDDGIIGPKTVKALEFHNPLWVARSLWQERMKHLGRITRDRPKNVKYIYGWINRMLGLYPEPAVEKRVRTLA